MRRRLGLFVGFAMLSMLGLALGGSAQADPGNGVSVVPVNGQAVGHGLRLFVDVFYARGGTPGPPGRGGGSSAPDCSAKADVNTQTGFASPFANANSGGLTLHVNAAVQPSGLDFVGALGTATTAWNTAAGRTVLSVNSSGGNGAPAQDGINSVGWAKLAPKSVLAATWTWVDASNTIIEADTFFNTMQPWTTSTSCPTSGDGNFVVQDIATHEFGHSLGLSHFSDTDAQATMYPSAPPDELRKITPTQGDVDALVSTLP